ncbi:hypothetical protein SELMODRAFT_155951 [Selaginella moellendorffii]|uniref:Uncharacterized protein n=1 Tax=Selaginella moellendorffii TaxID=88036 RepID=D8SJV7_SELML|nr:vacuole membrane protein KMS1 [Selaginella moellendorffii]EFJ15115.1 hypothetical protein SELMODRAFT_155951 [Selaginella moellendorffii]|eukprot:XP_002983619.1 vacuole membrane protein KMS1 [Selaginella moellendorffii]
MADEFSSPVAPTASSSFTSTIGIDPMKRLKRMHTRQREQLVLTKQPLTTTKFFLLAMLQHLGRIWIYAARHRFTFLLFLFLCFASGCTLLVVGGYEKVMEEAWLYFRFAVWWIGLGVASSIGLGSGLHTFVLYLGPHIAMFTLKATLCGRDDLKSAPYDTPYFGTSASWADKDCTSIGAPQFPRLASEHESYMVPLYNVLVQVQPEAVLWGIGTALGELPPYFVSRAARLSGERLKALDDIENESATKDSLLTRVRQWMVTKIQRFGFFTILICASVPNPLFDLAGMMCGHFLVPFWKFFLATLLGKAVIKTHIQTIFIILACNAHLVELILDSLTWSLSKVPTFSFILPRIRTTLQGAQESFRHGQQAKSGQPNMVAFAWNTFVMVILMGFLASIVNSTAQGYLMQRQLREMETVEKQEEQQQQAPRQD